MVFNDNQEKIIQGAVDHILRPDGKQVYQYSGGAGTGKTTVLLEIIRRIGYPLKNVAVMTYMGQPSAVLRTKGVWNAKTAHSYLYQLAEVEVRDEKGNLVYDPVFNVPKVELKFVPKALDKDIKYIIVDEAYTLPLRMKPEIEKRGLPIIVCGDANQLPPVKDDPAYLVDGEINFLTEIMRQNQNSGIVYLSDRILKGLPISAGLYGEVLVIPRKELSEEMIRRSQMVLCGTNRTRDFYNSKIREEMLGIQSTIPLKGEKVICRRNNWMIEVDGISLTNGLIGTVMNDTSVSIYDGKEFMIDFKPNGIDMLYKDLSCNYEYFNASNELRKLLKGSPYNKGEKFEPAYAITTHLSQGGEYSHGIYIKEFLHKDIQRNLDYTGLTRFKRNAIFVLPDKKYF